MTSLLSWQVPAEHVDDPVISCDMVTKQFGTHRVLDGITYDVPRGQTTAILGPSGTGKSVMLKVIIGLLKPDYGEIIVDGEKATGIPHKDLLRIRRKFGVLFQDGALFGSMNLYDNIAFPMREHTDASEKEIRVAVMENAELVGLVAHLDKLPGEVSGGMKKRAGLARALVLHPPIVLFDEPDSGLDPVRVAYLDDLVNTAQRETGSTFFIITHNIASVRRVAHYLGVLFRSKLVAFGSRDFMKEIDNPVVNQLLAGRPEGPISMDEMAESDDRKTADANAAGASEGLFDDDEDDTDWDSDGSDEQDRTLANPANGGGHSGSEAERRRAAQRADAEDPRYDDEDWETPPGR